MSIRHSRRTLQLEGVRYHTRRSTMNTQNSIQSRERWATAQIAAIAGVLHSAAVAPGVRSVESTHIVTGMAAELNAILIGYAAGELPWSILPTWSEKYPIELKGTHGHRAGGVQRATGCSRCARELPFWLAIYSALGTSPLYTPGGSIGRRERRDLGQAKQATST